MTRLKTVLEQELRALKDHGVSISYDDSRAPNSYSANLDSDGYVGTITHWPESRFEFQFNSCESGKVIFLETKNIHDDAKLGAYIEEIFRTKLT